MEAQPGSRSTWCNSHGGLHIYFAISNLDATLDLANIGQRELRHGNDRPSGRNFSRRKQFIHNAHHWHDRADERLPVQSFFQFGFL